MAPRPGGRPLTTTENPGPVEGRPLGRRGLATAATPERLAALQGLADGDREGVCPVSSRSPGRACRPGVGWRACERPGGDRGEATAEEVPVLWDQAGGLDPGHAGTPVHRARLAQARAAPCASGQRRRRGRRREGWTGALPGPPGTADHRFAAWTPGGGAEGLRRRGLGPAHGRLPRTCRARAGPRPGAEPPGGRGAHGPGATSRGPRSGSKRAWPSTGRS